MAKTVFILGAGASVSAGVPVMNDFWNVGKLNWRLGNFKRFEEDFRIIHELQILLQRTQSYVNIDYTNLESFVTALDMALLVDKLDQINPNDRPRIIEALTNVLVATIEETMEFPRNEKFQTFVRPPLGYDELAILINGMKQQANPTHDVSIITFNYDLGLDYAMNVHELNPNYCLYGDPKNGMKLLKLHGSMNWFQYQETKELRIIDFKTLFEQKVFKLNFKKNFKTEIGRNIVNISGGGLEKTPFIAPPSWNKSTYHQQLANVWRHAALELSSAENIIVIGFSLPDTDQFFKNLIALGMVGDTYLERFWVFNPDISLEEKYRKFLGVTALSKFGFNVHEPWNELGSTSKLLNDSEPGTFANAIWVLATHFGIGNIFRDI